MTEVTRSNWMPKPQGDERAHVKSAYRDPQDFVDVLGSVDLPVAVDEVVVSRFDSTKRVVIELQGEARRVAIRGHAVVRSAHSKERSDASPVAQGSYNSLEHSYETEKSKLDKSYASSRGRGGGVTTLRAVRTEGKLGKYTSANLRADDFSGPTHAEGAVTIEREGYKHTIGDPERAAKVSELIVRRARKDIVDKARTKLEPTD